MALKFSHKTKSSRNPELFADRGHPGPKFLTLITGSAFETSVDSLPKVKNSARI
jgi:hypothetical protein